MNKHLAGLTFALSACISENEACVNDAAEQGNGSAVIDIVDVTNDCVNVIVKGLEEDSGIACFAQDGNKLWNLEGELLGDGTAEFCGLNGAVKLVCVETNGNRDGEVTCEALIPIEE